MLERVGERGVESDARRVAFGQLPQRLLELRLPRAKENKLRVEQPQRLRRDDLIQSLLRDEAGAHSEERNIGAARQPPRLLEHRLAAHLSREILGAEVRRDLFVRDGIPLLDVDAVANADEPVAELAERVLEPKAANVCEQLEGVGRTHRRHHIGEGQAALQIVETAVPFHEIGRPEINRQRDVSEHRQREDALESAVVNREDAGESLEIGLVTIHATQEDRHQRGVPVVGVQDQIAFADASRDFDRRGGEQREAAMGVRIIAAPPRVAVDAGTVERSIVLEEERLGVLVVGETPETHLRARATTLDRERIEQWLELAGVLARFTIQRQYDVGLHATRGLMVSQIRNRLAEPARAGERPQLCGEVENPGLQYSPVVMVAARQGVLPRQLRERSSSSRSSAASAEW